MTGSGWIDHSPHPDFFARTRSEVRPPHKGEVGLSVTCDALSDPKLPANERGAPGEAPAHGLHEHKVAPFDAAVLDRDRECQGDGSRRGVAVIGDRRDHAVGPNPELPRGSIEN